MGLLIHGSFWGLETVLEPRSRAENKTPGVFLHARSMGNGPGS